MQPILAAGFDKVVKSVGCGKRNNCGSEKVKRVLNPFLFCRSTPMNGCKYEEEEKESRQGIY